jgi:hypothetical protein
MTIEVEFANWFTPGREPIGKEGWAEFFAKHFLPDNCIIGSGNDLEQCDEAIALDNVTITVTEIK